MIIPFSLKILTQAKFTHMYAHHISSNIHLQTSLNPIQIAGTQVAQLFFPQCESKPLSKKHEGCKTNVWLSARGGRYRSKDLEITHKARVNSAFRLKHTAEYFKQWIFPGRERQQSAFLSAGPLACALTSCGRSDMWLTTDTSAHAINL